MKILFVDPYAAIADIKITPGIPYLRGFLEHRKIETETINFNTLFDEALKKRYFHELAKLIPRTDISEVKSKIAITEINTAFSPIWRHIYRQDYKDIINLANRIKILDNFFDENLFPLDRFGFIAISISYHSQLFFSLILLNYIKRKCKTARIIIGGQNVTMSTNDYINIFDIKPLVDYMVVGEGETAIYRLIAAKGKPSHIPNLIYKRNNKFVRSQNQNFSEDVSQLSPPVYEGSETVYLQTTRKCYYNQCRFCSDSVFSKSQPGNYRPTDDVIKDIKTALETNPIKHIHFTDSCLPVKTFIELAQKVAKDNVLRKIDYSAFLRAEKQFDLDVFRMAKKAGFSALAIGVETFVPRLQKLINKNIDLRNCLNIAKYCDQTGIDLQFNFIFNLPTQTKHELDHDIKIICQLLKKFPKIRIVVSFFALFPDSYMFRHQNEFAIKPTNRSLIKFFNGQSHIRLDREAVESDGFYDFATTTFSDELTEPERSRLSISNR